MALYPLYLPTYPNPSSMVITSHLSLSMSLLLKTVFFKYYKCHLLILLWYLISIFILVLVTTCILELPAGLSQTSLRSFQITYPVAHCHCSLDVPRVQLKLTCQHLSHIILSFPGPLISKLILFHSPHIIYLYEFFI